MYLYEKVNKQIRIYDLAPDYDKLIDYRKKEMEDNTDIFFTAEADSWAKNKILENSDTVNIKDLNSKDKPIFIPSNVTAYDNKFHSFKSDVTNESILNNYYLGIYKDSRIVEVYEEKFNPILPAPFNTIGTLRGLGVEGTINNKPFASNFEIEKQTLYYLLITGSYELQTLSSRIAMHNIISLPKSLYLLQMLEQSNFTKLDNEDINELLDLFYFSVSPVQIIPLEYLDNAFKYGLINETSKDISKKVNDSSKILQKIRKR